MHVFTTTDAAGRLDAWGVAHEPSADVDLAMAADILDLGGVAF